MKGSRDLCDGAGSQSWLIVVDLHIVSSTDKHLSPGAANQPAKITHKDTNTKKKNLTNPIRLDDPRRMCCDANVQFDQFKAFEKLQLQTMKSIITPVWCKNRHWRLLQGSDEGKPSTHFSH